MSPHKKAAQLGSLFVFKRRQPPVQYSEDKSMPDYYSKFTVSPSEIPHDLITPEIKERLEALDVNVDEYPEGFFLNGDYYNDDVPEILQEIIVSSGGRITEMTIEGASTASRLVVDSQGGFALFITADEIKSINTGLWLSQQKDSNDH